MVHIPAQHVRQCCWPLLTCVDCLPSPAALARSLSDAIALALWYICRLLLYGGCSFDENEGTCAIASEEPAHVCRSAQAEIFSVVSDRDGATLFMDPRGVEIFSRAVRVCRPGALFNLCCL